MLALACAVYVGYRTDAITFIATMPCIEVARIADNDQPTLIDDADWQPLSPREPPGSGSSAVQKENGTRLSCGLSGQVAHLVKPKRDLRLFDATTPETKAACEANCFHAWCELSPRGLAEAFSDSARLDGPDSPAGTGIPFVPNQTAGHARWVARQGPDTRARLSLDARAVGTLNDRLRPPAPWLRAGVDDGAGVRSLPPRSPRASPRGLEGLSAKLPARAWAVDGGGRRGQPSTAKRARNSARRLVAGDLRGRTLVRYAMC